MAKQITEEMKQKAWEYGRKSKDHYNVLTDEQKKAFWEYGQSNKLYDTNSLDDYKRSEYNKYIPSKKDDKPWYAKVKDVITDQSPYKPSGNKLVDFINRTGQTGANFLMGSTPKDSNYVAPIPTGSKGLDIFSDIAGGAMGIIGGSKAIGNMAGSTKGIIGEGTRLGERLLPKLGKIGTSKIGQELVKGATAGAAVDVAQGIKENDSVKDLALRVGRGALIGAPLDLAGYGISQAFLKRASKNVVDNLVEGIAKNENIPSDQVRQEINKILLLPEGQPTGPRMVRDGEIIYASGGKPETLALPEGTEPFKRTVYKGPDNPILDDVMKEYERRLENGKWLLDRKVPESRSYIKNVIDEFEPKIRQAENATSEEIQQYIKNNRQNDFETVFREPKLQFKKQVELPRIKEVVPENIKKPDSLYTASQRIRVPQVRRGTGTIDDPFRWETPNQATKEIASTVETLRPTNQEELAQQFSSKISREVKKPKKQSISEVTEKFRVQFTDRLTALDRLEKQVKGSTDDATKSLYKQARLFSGVPEKASETIRTQLEPTIKSVEDAGFSYKELGDYAEAMHARDVNALGLKSGFTDEEINAVINKYANNEVMENARQQLLRYNDSLIQELADSGRISQDSLQSMREKYPNYMPLNRNFDDTKVEFGNFIREKFSNPSQPIKSLKGSEREVIDPIESMIKNTYNIIASAEQNNVGKQLIELADIDVDGQFIRRLADGEQIGRKNVVTTYLDGNKVQFEVDPEVYKAMEGLNKQSSSLLIQTLAKPASVLRAGATLTPEFAVRNPIRDIAQAYVTKGFNPITDFARGLASVLKKDELYSQFLKEKGGFGNLTSYDRTSNRKILEDVIKQPTSKKFVNVINPKSWLELLRVLSDTTETATKVGMFQKGIREGLTSAEAAYQARDLMDFARSGSTVKEANKIIAFLNANIQGKSKIVRAIQEDPKGVTARIIKGIVIPAITVKALQYTTANEEQLKTIQDAPDWQRDTFYLIPIPGTDQIARIPKPFDLAVIPNTIERFIDYGYGQDKAAFDGYFRATLSEQMVPLIPTIGVPITEGLTNTSFFRQSPIIPQREKNLPREMQYDVNTSELSKQIAGVVRPIVGDEGLASNFGSPRIIDNTIRGYTAGLGNYVLDIYDYISGATGLSEKKTKPAKQFDVPVLGQLGRGFTVNDMSTGKSLDYVYKEYNKLYTTRQGLKQEGKELPSLDKSKLNILNKSKNEISDISKEMREIQNSKTYSAERKRELLLELNKTRNNLAIETKKQIERLK